jgi:hypothetical protein
MRKFPHFVTVFNFDPALVYGGGFPISSFDNVVNHPVHILTEEAVHTGRH